MSAPQITELASDLFFPEGPVWMPDGTVLVTELGGKCVTRVWPDGSKDTVATPGGSPNGLAIGPDGAGYVCNSGGWRFLEFGGLRVTDLEQPDDYTGGRIERIDLVTGEVTVLYTGCGGNELAGPNDLVFDTHGGFYFTDHGKQRGRVQTLGGIYYAQPDGSQIREVVFPIHGPNGVGLSPDGSRLYAAETHTGRLYAWEVIGPGQVAGDAAIGHGGQLMCGLPGMQLFDSLAVDGEGNIVVATLVTGALSVVSPSGELLDQVAVPDPMVTNLCFGGPDLATAYVTLSATGRLVSVPWVRPGLALAF